MMSEGSWFRMEMMSEGSSFKKPGGIPFFLYPASLARSGKVNLIYIKSAWKMQAFGTGFIKGTQGNHIET